MKELEMILATIGQLGAAGKEAFIWWLIFDKLIPTIGWLIALWISSYSIGRIACMFSVATKLRDAMGVGSRGVLLEDEVRAMFAWVAQRRDR